MFYGLNKFVKNILPKRLFYRALLIVAVPVIVLQLVITIVFFDSLWIKTNKGMTKALINEINTFIVIYDDEIYKNDDFKDWYNEWQKRLKLNNSSDKHLELMKKNNPLVIPRNHKVEEALTDADKGNLETMNMFLKVLSNPYSLQENIIEFQKPAPISDEKYQTFCGT